MPRNNKAKQVPERAKEAADPDPDMTPHVSKEPKGQSFFFSPERVQGAR